MQKLVLVMLLPGLVACRRDPVLIGFWDVEELEIEGIAQPDWGTMEIRADGKAQVIARYAWTGGGFEPLDQPEHWETITDGGEQEDFIEAYEKKGEVHEVKFGYDVYLVEDYIGAACRLVGHKVSPPGEEPQSYDDLEASQAITKVEVIYSLAR